MDLTCTAANLQAASGRVTIIKEEITKTLIKTHLVILAFFSNSADRPVSVSISASLADTELDCDALDDCLAI